MLINLIDFSVDYYLHIKMSDRKAVIKNADMSEEMQQDAVDCATQALEKYNIEKVKNYHVLRLKCSHKMLYVLVRTSFVLTWFNLKF